MILDPFQGYANVIRDELPEATSVLDAYPPVFLGCAIMDEARHGLQRDTLGHLGQAGDLL